MLGDLLCCIGRFEDVHHMHTFHLACGGSIESLDVLSLVSNALVSLNAYIAFDTRAPQSHESINN